MESIKSKKIRGLTSSKTETELRGNTVVEKGVVERKSSIIAKKFLHQQNSQRLEQATGGNQEPKNSECLQKYSGLLDGKKKRAEDHEPNFVISYVSLSVL